MYDSLNGKDELTNRAGTRLEDVSVTSENYSSFKEKSILGNAQLVLSGSNFIATRPEEARICQIPTQALLMHQLYWISLRFT